MPPRSFRFAFASIACAAVIGAKPVTAQVRLGLRAGVSLSAAAPDARMFSFDARDFRLSVEDVAAGLHVGLFAQASLGERFALQPELLFHATRTDYLLEELLGASTVETVRAERIGTVEMPILLAYRWGPLRLQAGPVGRARVAESSELSGVANYRPDPGADAIRFGYQAGLGLDVWRLLLDIKYDGRFAAQGASVDIGGQQLAFSRRASRTYFTIGYALFGQKS